MGFFARLNRFEMRGQEPERGLLEGGERHEFS